MFKKGDVIKVVKNVFDPQWDFLIGKIGTIIDVAVDGVGDFDVQFDYDEFWADSFFGVTTEEIELFEKGE